MYVTCEGKCEGRHSSPASLHLRSVIRAAVVDTGPALIQLPGRAEGYYPLIHRGGAEAGGGGGGGGPAPVAQLLTAKKEIRLHCN